jgi:hypothetical protein
MHGLAFDLQDAIAMFAADARTYLGDFRKSGRRRLFARVARERG